MPNRTRPDNLRCLRRGRGLLLLFLLILYYIQNILSEKEIVTTLKPYKILIFAWISTKPLIKY